MPEELNPEALARYLSGRSTPKEEQHVRAWLDVHPHLRHDLEGIPAAETSALHHNPEAALARILDRARLAALPEGSQPSRSPADRSRLPGQPLRRYAPLLRVAAMVAGLVLLALLAQRFITNDAAPSYREFATQPGERSTLTLSDGTIVELNVDTRLRLPASFDQARREVWLDGEAFFTVARDADRPFIIHSGTAQIEVLGTSFNVDAYPGASSVAVVVVEGRVAFRPATSPDTSAVLTSGTMGRLVAGTTLSVEPVDPEASVAWRQGRLVFTGTPLSDVARELTRWYDVEVRLEEERLASLRLDAAFHDEPLSAVLATIATALDIDYRMDEDAVWLTSN